MTHLVLVAIVAIVPAAAAQRGSEPRDQARAQRHHSRRAATPLVGQPESSPYFADFCTACERDANDRIRRSPAARRAFHAANPCPATGLPTGACPGYVVDHIIPLKRGGPDDPSNMQWQTVEEAKANDRLE